jgi:hypothetical protein
MSNARKLLIGALREGLVPVLLQNGFTQIPLHRISPEMERVFPFGYMRRVKGSRHESVEIQLDKYGRPKFVLNCGVVPPEGVDLPWAHLERDKASASDLPEAYRLHSCKGCMRWFSPPWFAWPRDLESRTRKAVAQATSLYPEIDSWFASGKVGPHMRRFGYPIKVKPDK